MVQKRDWAWLRSWEMLLAVVLLAVIFINWQNSPFYFQSGNLANVFKLSIEKAIVALIMTFIIINGEIDLSVASVMAFAGCLFAYLYRDGWAVWPAILAAMLAGGVCGALNGYFVAYLGLPSLAVTLAGLIGYRGAARILLEGESVSGFPTWFTRFGQQGFIGTFPATVFVLLLLFLLFGLVLHYTAFGRYVYIIGNNKEAALYAGVRVRRVKMTLFTVSGLMAAFAGLLYVSRLGTVRANLAEGFELDIITMVLLGGVSIFGGTGSMLGVGLSLLVVLNLRNGMSLQNIGGNIQNSIVGVLLILSVLIPNWLRDFQQWRNRRAAQISRPSEQKPDQADQKGVGEMT